MRKIVWALAAVGWLSGCADPKGGVKDPPGTQPPSLEPAGPLSVPTPYPTPSGPVYIVDLYTPDETPLIAGGECIGFTLVGNTATLGTDLTVTLGRWNLPVTPIDAKHARVGAPETGGVCTWMPLFLSTSGTYSPVVTTLGGSYVLDEKITVVPVDAVDVGRVFEEKVWETGAFEKPFDTDVYYVNFDDIIRRYSDVDFFPSGTVPVVPSMEFWDEDYKAAPLAQGGMGLIFPQGSYNYILVRDVEGLGGPGADYEIAFVADTLAGRTPADDCGGAPYMREAHSYYVDYEELSDDFHPSCPDSVYGAPVRGPLADGVWRVIVPAHTQLRVSSYDDHLDSTIFLMPTSEGCPHSPSTCTAAAGWFGGGNTDTLVYSNATDADQEFYLVHDAVSIHWKPEEVDKPDRKVGGFLVDVEFFPL